MYVFPLILGFAILLGSSIALIRFLRKNNKPKWSLILVISGFILLSVGLVNGVYKPYGLYERHYLVATGTQFPTDGDYKFADTWIDNEEGAGYSSVSLVELSAKSRADLIQVLKNKKFTQVSDSLKIADKLNERLTYVLAISTSKNVEEEYGFVETKEILKNGRLFLVKRIKYYFAFLDDGKSVFIYIIND